MIERFIKNKIIELCNSFYELWTNANDDHEEQYAIIIAVLTIPLSLLCYICIPTLCNDDPLIINIVLKLFLSTVISFTSLVFGLFVVFDRFGIPLYRWIKKEIELLKSGYDAKPKWKK